MYTIFFNFGVTDNSRREDVLFDDITFERQQTTGTSTVLHYQWILNLQRLLIRLVLTEELTKLLIHSTGINTSATVAQMVKGAGQPWAGAKIVMASAVDFSTKKPLR
jgi:hypothetical protein